MEHCIETYELTKAYGGRNVVDQLNLKVAHGSFYGFLGPNGAGKSTTIKMLTGITAPNAGRARLLGCDLQRHAMALKRRMGVVPEEMCLFENLTAPEYLVFVGRMYGLSSSIALSRAEELLALLGLGDARHTLILEYSHGMRKKLAFCAALIHDPELLFLDEPFEGVDAIASRTIRDVLNRVLARGATIFLTSHVLEIVERLCTHVGIINSGKLVCQGPLHELSGGERLDEIFLRLVGRPLEAAPSLSWLEK